MNPPKWRGRPDITQVSSYAFLPSGPRGAGKAAGNSLAELKKQLHPVYLWFTFVVIQGACCFRDALQWTLLKDNH
jgi:hypothetical protein